MIGLILKSRDTGTTTMAVTRKVGGSVRNERLVP